MYRVGQLVDIKMMNPGDRAYCGFCRLISKSSVGLLFETKLGVKIFIVSARGRALVLDCTGQPDDVVVTQKGVNPNGEPFRDEGRAHFYAFVGEILLIDKKQEENPIVEYFDKAFR